MKNILKLFNTTLLLLTFCLSANAQDFAKVDNTVKAYGRFTDLTELARQMDKDFKSEEDRARAIFTYIAVNVKYDLPAYGNMEPPVAFSYRTPAEKEAKERQFKDDLAVKTLKSKKGVCQGYATLYEALAMRLGLQSAIIPGTSKSNLTHIGKQPGASDHAWNAVKVNGKWQLLDVTWGAGTIIGSPAAFQFKFNDSYFLTDPNDFVLNHYPDDEKWLMTTASKEDFAQLPLYYGNYLMGGYEFVSPGIGTFTNPKANLVPFKIRNLKPTDEVAYAFSKDKKFRMVKPKKNGDVSEFDVLLDNNSNGYLTIFINQRSVAAYRINRA